MNKLHLLSVVMIALMLDASAQAQQAPSDYRVDDTEYEQLIKKMTPPGYNSAEKQKLRDLVYSKKWKSANELCDKIISRPIKDFPNPYYGLNMKSVAHNYKATIEQNTTNNPSTVIANQVAAARLGHVEAAEWFALYLFKNQPDVFAYALSLSKKQLTDLLRVGADLGETNSETVLGMSRLPLEIDAEERLYWALLAVVRDSSADKDARQTFVQSIIDKFGESVISSVLGKYSLVGSPFKSSDGLPGRGILNTLSAESDLRGSLGSAFGSYRDTSEPAPKAPTIREQFDVYSRLIPEVTFGDVYMKVAGPSSIKSSRVISSDASTIIPDLRPGDRVFLGCGPLSHVAFFLKRDPQKKTLMFIDPNYEFWMPNLNTCVSSFDLKEFIHSRYLSEVPEDDVKNMLQAVIVMRDNK